jgi:6-phospho-3-hexuloisomerase
VAIATVARRHGARIAYLGANMPSTIGSLSHLQVRIPVPTKLNLGGEVKSQQIMTSLFEQTVLLLGDAMALALAQRRNVDPAQLWRFHANLE